MAEGECMLVRLAQLDHRYLRIGAAIVALGRCRPEERSAIYEARLGVPSMDLCGVEHSQDAIDWALFGEIARERRARSPLPPPPADYDPFADDPRSRLVEAWSHLEIQDRRDFLRAVFRGTS